MRSNAGDQFEQIDALSHKIGDIIRSISTSNHKKNVGSHEVKTCRMERSETITKLNKLHDKYDNGHHGHTQRDYKARIIEQLREEKGRGVEVKKKEVKNEAKFFKEGI